MRRFSILFGLFTLVVAVAAIPAPDDLPTTPIADEWMWPLGGDGYQYTTKQNRQHGTFLENTNYRVRNLDLLNPSDNHIGCQGVGMHRLWHAGVDLYRSGASTAGADVHAIADGIITYNEDAFYPGSVVIVEHTLPDGHLIYSMYAHLDFPIDKGEGEAVSLGEVLGQVRANDYTGRFPQLRPDGDDAHLHFEIRTFADGSNLYPAEHPCNFGDYPPGLGYTYPDLPDALGYLDPLHFLAERIPQPEPAHEVFLPAIRNGDGCLEGQELVRYNGGFEFTVYKPAPWIEATTYFDLPDIRYYYFVQHNPSAAYAGYQSALLGDAVFAANPIDEELVQSVAIPGGVTWLEWRQRVRLAQTFPLPDDTGTAEGDTHILTLKDAETGQSVIADIRIDHTSSDYPNEVWLNLTIVITGVEALKNRPISLSYSSLANGDAVRSTMRLDGVQLIAHCGAVPSGAALRIGAGAG